MKNAARYITKHINKRLIALILAFILVHTSSAVIFTSADNTTGDTITIDNPNGSLQNMIEADLQTAPFNQTAGNYDYTVVTSLTITGDMTADDFTFMRVNLSALVELDIVNITYPDSEYPESVFNSLIALKKIRLPDNIILSYAMFANCLNLDTLVCGNGDFTEGVIDLTGYKESSYGMDVFNSTGAKKARLPADIKLSNGLFIFSKNLDTLVFGNGAFTDGVIDLTDYAVSSYDFNVFFGTGAKKVRLPEDIELLHGMFTHCSELDTLVFGSRTLEGGIIDFTGYNGSSYGERIFEGTAAYKVRLTEDIPLADVMFTGCTNLDTLVCGNGVFTEGMIDLSGYTASSYGSQVFACSGVKSVILRGTIPLSQSMFTGCTNLDTLVCGNGVFTEGMIDLSGYTASSYGSQVFANSGVKSVILPGTIPLSQFMFNNCSNLNTLRFVGGDTAPVEDINTNPFWGVSATGTLYYPAGATGYNAAAFGGFLFGGGNFSLSGWTFIPYDENGPLPTPPSVPQNVTAAPYNGAVILTWSPPLSNGDSPSVNYQVQKDADGWIVIQDVRMTNALFTELTNGITYTFSVRAVNSNGNIGDAVTITAVPTGTQSAPTGPSVPQNVTATPGDGQVTLSWSTPVDDGGYPILKYQVLQTDDGLWIDVAVADNDTYSYTFTDLTNGSEYHFGVRAFSTLDIGEPVFVDATPIGPPIPDNTHTLIFNTFDGNFYIDSNDSGVYDYGDALYTDQSDKWSWNADTSTLTLNGFTWETPADIAMIIQSCYIYDAQSNDFYRNDITLFLNGTNTIRSTSDGSDISVGLAYYGHTLNVTGTGILNVYSGRTSQISCALNIQYNLIMNGGRINAYKGDSDNTNFGILSGDMTVNDGIIDIVGGSGGIAPISIGIYLTPASANLNFSGNLHVSGGEIIAYNGSNPNLTSLLGCGIWAEGDILIAGGKITSAGNPSPSDYSVGIMCGYVDAQNIPRGGNITITGGNVSAKGIAGALYSVTGIPVAVTAPVYRYWTNNGTGSLDVEWTQYPGSEGFVNSPDYMYVSIEIIAPNYGISLTPNSYTYTFPDATVGYSMPPEKIVTVTNTGNTYTGELMLAFSGANADSFTLSGTSGGGSINLNVGSGFSFPIAPKIGLPAGTYTTVLTISGNNNLYASFTVTFTVKADQQMPSPSPDTRYYYNSLPNNPLSGINLNTNLNNSEQDGKVISNNISSNVNLKDYYKNGSYTFKSNPNKRGDGSYNPSVFTISADMLNSAYNATKSSAETFNLIFESPVASYVIPANFTSLIPDYLNLIKGRTGPISVKVTITDNSASNKVAKAISAAVDFKVELTDANGNVISEIKNFTGNIERLLPTTLSVKPAYYGAYMRKDKNSPWEFIPHSYVVSTDGNGYVSILSNTNSEYVVVEYIPVFADIAKGKWDYENIMVAAAKKLVQGMGNNLYVPENQVTRAEFVTMIVRALRLPDIKDGKSAYTDVNTADWFYDVIIKAKSAGLLGLLGTTECKPNQPMSREEMAYVLAKAAEYCKIKIPNTDIDIKTKFTDANSIDSKYASYVTNTVKLGLMQGMSATTFEGKGTVTRAQAATVLVNMCKAFGYID